MELPVDAARITGASDPITVWDSAALRRHRANPQLPVLYRVIDELGRGSRVAQGLNHVLTSVERLIENPAHRLYLLMKDKVAVGIIKVGPKKLFIRTKSAELKEIDPLCVLDFYVVETEQRSGYGRVLYDTMLLREGVQPHQLGYDRPSPKFIAFLRKHFGLSEYIPQSNNFVVFEAYFDRSTRGTSTAVPSSAGSGAGFSNVARTSNPMLPDHGQASPQPASHGPPAPIPLNTAGRGPTVASAGGSSRGGSCGAPGNSLLGGAATTAPQSAGGYGRLAATLPPSSSANSNHYLGGPPTKQQHHSMHGAATPMSANVAAAAQRGGRDLSPATRSSMAYNIITLEGADGSSPPQQQQQQQPALSRSVGAAGGGGVAPHERQQRMSSLRR